MSKKLLDRIHPSAVFIGFVTGIILGVIVGVVFRVKFFTSIYWVLFSLILLFFGIWKPTKIIILFGILAGATLGLFRVSSEIIGQDFFKEVDEKTIEVRGKVKGDVDSDEKEMKVRLSSLEISGEKIRGVIYLSGKLDNKIERDDILTIRGNVSEGFGAFVASFKNPEVKKIERAENRNSLVKLRDEFAKSVRIGIVGEKKKSFNESGLEQVENNSEEDLDESNEIEEKAEVLEMIDETGEREASLGLAYLLGLKNGLDTELLEVLSLVGLSHIVVASGTHLGILVGFFRKYFGKISRFSGMFFSLIFVVLFGTMIGWTASITRAAIVTIVGTLGWFFGRKPEGWRIILIAMAITLLLNPMYLVDLGWLLSFGSFIGILILCPIVVRFFYGETFGGKYIVGKKPNEVAQIFLATLSATLMCAPILLYFFGSLSIISFVANLLILPTIPIAMGLVFLTGATGLIPWSFIKPLQLIVVKFTTLLLDYHIVVMNYFSKQTSFILSVPSKDLRVFLLYVPILIPFVVAEVLRRRKLKKQTEKIRKYSEKYLRLYKEKRKV
ncbi:ComEC/Rec2 family competence protein [Candidatus Saccharibacteria bacterium]|nr:ComEC/Rec2 family competence protein [Candidatus Saccharibacteria bacterium]